MNWEKLTAEEFEKAVDACEGVCLLPIGVIEKHGDHLPLGQDTLYVHSFCTKAAGEEPAMVFPQYYFGQINEARHQPGCIAVDSGLLLPLLESVCDEISRNGFKKILIVNGHGGNVNFLSYFLETLLDRDKDYAVFYTSFRRDRQTEEKKYMEASIDGHGGESETSRALYFFPELVKSETPADYGRPLKRLEEYERLDMKTSMDWYSNHPWHLRADRTPGSREKGRLIVETRTKKLIEMIRLLKKDNTPAELYRKFREQARGPSNA